MVSVAGCKQQESDCRLAWRAGLADEDKWLPQKKLKGSQGSEKGRGLCNEHLQHQDRDSPRVWEKMG